MKMKINEKVKKMILGDSIISNKKQEHKFEG